ncbi:MAG: hypothetical protein ABIR24_14355 [Verrucomicrobiota bacterium]
MNQIEVLNPVEQVKLGSETVEMRQLPFLRAFEFTKQLSAIAGKLFDKDGSFIIARKKNPTDTKAELNLAPLADAITSSGDLTSFLLLHSTVGKDQAWLEKLSTAEGLKLLHVAIRLNLSKEILSLGNELAASLAGVFASQKAAKTLSKQSIS